MYRTFYLKEAKYILFSNAHGSFSKIDHKVRHKTSFNKLNNIEIISSILYHNDLKRETNFKEKTQKHSNSYRLNNMLLNNE